MDETFGRNCDSCYGLIKGSGAYIDAAGQVRQVNFFRSAETGEIGASEQLIQALEKNGIKHEIHY